MQGIRTTWLGLCAVAALSFSGGALAQSPLFAPIYEVLTHPRCLNCHTVTDFPRQGDERRRHDQLVMRGDDNHGVPTLQCSACHQKQNVADDNVPGAPHWGLAPLSMGWEGLNPQQLCEALKDQSKNGGKDLAALLKHMSEDPLVLWGFAPGEGRSLPPVDHPRFVELLSDWVAAGGPC